MHNFYNDSVIVGNKINSFAEVKGAGGRSSNENENNELIQMSILKLYPLIIEEMEARTKTFILNELRKTKMLSEDDFNRIDKCPKRRPAIGMLLQTVIHYYALLELTCYFYTGIY